MTGASGQKVQKDSEMGLRQVEVSSKALSGGATEARRRQNS